MSNRSRKGRHVLYVGRVPEDFLPGSPTELPQQLTELRILDSGLSLCQAVAVLRHHNRERLGPGGGDRQWAILAFRPKGGVV
jgi:hypothetical protein